MSSYSRTKVAPSEYIKKLHITLLFLDEKKQKSSDSTESWLKNFLLQLKSFNSAPSLKDFYAYKTFLNADSVNVGKNNPSSLKV
jgi:hypothetical protein